MRYKPKSSAALNIALGGLPAQMPVEVDSGHRNIGDDRPRTSQAYNMARKFGHYDAVGPLSRERGKGEQGYGRDSHVAEVVARIPY